MVALLVLIARNREAARRTQCRCRFKQISTALLNYHDIYNELPPAYTVDQKGIPLHSWRTLIFPYLDQQKLYASIDLSKPLNDPVNAEAYKAVIPTYHCPSISLEATCTTYMAVVTPESVIRPIRSCQISDVIDGTSNTLMIVEVTPQNAVHWMAPDDADEQIFQFGRVAKMNPHGKGCHGALVDGIVRWLSDTMPHEQIHALITVNRGESVGEF